MNKRIVHIIPHQHFDLVWRRDYDWYEARRAELYMQALQLLRENSGFTFCFCQVWPLRQFLDKYQALRQEFSRFLRDGRIEIVGGMESICDLNLSSPFAIERNIASGREWLSEQFGYEVTAAAFEDAFGVSAQLPQLIERCGYKFYKAGRMPRPGQSDVSGDFLWQGLDGTTVKCISPGADGCSWGWGYPDNPDEPGIPDFATRYGRIKAQLLKATAVPLPHILFVAMGEEHDIFTGITQLVADLNGENSEVEFRFSSYNSYFASLDEAYWQTVPVIDAGTTDLSRIFTGCYTSRQESKLHPRRLEHRLLAAEFGGGNAAELAWQGLYLMQFHDAICGCHIDENATRLNGLYQKSMKGLEMQPSVIPWTSQLPDSRRHPGAIGIPRDVAVSHGDWRLTFRNGFWTDAAYCGTSVGTVAALSLREENGTLWTEEYTGKSRIFTAAEETLVAYGQNDECLELAVSGGCEVFRTMWPGFSRLRYRKTLRFFKASPLVLVDIDIDWLGNSTEIAVRWHHDGTSLDRCRAEIPFGSVERTAYEPCMLQGDSFPALNWVRTGDFAVINSGTPGHALRNGALETILMRSPVKRWAPWFPVTPPESSWDNGAHHFSFIYHVACCDIGNAELHRLGMEFNIATVAEPESAVLAAMPENLVIAGITTGADGKRELLLFEAEGREANFKGTFQPWQIRKVTYHE